MQLFVVEKQSRGVSGWAWVILHNLDLSFLDDFFKSSSLQLFTVDGSLSYNKRTEFSSNPHSTYFYIRSSH